MTLDVMVALFLLGPTLVVYSVCLLCLAAFSALARLRGRSARRRLERESERLYWLTVDVDEAAERLLRGRRGDERRQ